MYSFSSEYHLYVYVNHAYIFIVATTTSSYNNIYMNIILQYISRHVYNKNNNINIEYGNNLKCVINMRVNNIIIEIDIYIEIKIYV